MKKPPSRAEIDQEIRRRQERFARTKERDLLETLREGNPARSALTPKEQAEIAQPLTQFWQARHSQLALRDKKGPLSDALTLPEAAEYLRVSERTILRLIEAKTLPAQKILFQKKRRWMIERGELKRYRALEWVRSCEVPLPEPPEGLIPRFAFAPRQGYRGIPRFTLTVSLKEYWRFVCKPIQNRRECAARKAEIRKRLPDNPQDFVVCFRLDPGEVWPTLEGIVRSVRIPKKVRGKDQDDLQKEALLHIMEHTLRSLHQVHRGWVGYFQKSVSNFYLDQVRQETTHSHTEKEWTHLTTQENHTCSAP